MELRDRARQVQLSKRHAHFRSSSFCWMLGLGASALALSAGHAAAQVQAPGLNATPAIPATAERRVDFNVLAGVIYDSNVAGGQSVIADVKGLHPDDVIVDPTVRADVVLPVGPTALFLNGSAGYDFYNYNKNLESARVNVLGGVLGHAGRCNGGLTAGYAVRQTDQSDLPIETVRNIQTTESGGVQAGCLVGHSLQVNLDVQTSSLDNSADLGVVDSRQSGVTGGVSYTNKLIGNIGLEAGYQRITYTSTDPLGFSQPGIKDYTLGVSFSRPIGQRLNGTATLSWSEIHSDDPATPDFSTWSGRGALQYQVNPRFGLNFSYTRAAYPTIQEGFSYSLDQVFSIRGSYRLSSHLDTNLGFLWDDRDYLSPSGPISLVEITHENREEVFGAITLHLLRGASLTLDARYTDRNTNLTVFNYKDYRVGLTASKSF